MSCYEECTYDQPSNRKRNPAPQYVETLEIRLQRAEALLKSISPDVDLNDPFFDSQEPTLVLASQSVRQPGLGLHDDSSKQLEDGNSQHSDSGEQACLESMVRATGLLDLDEHGHWDYHGHSSGTSFVHRMHELFGDIVGTDKYAAPYIKFRPMGGAIERSGSTVGLPTDNQLPCDLPPREVAKRISSSAINDAASLLRFMHEPSFMKSLDHIYDTPPQNFGNDENKFLPLLYATLALGCLFTQDEDSALGRLGYQNAIDEG